MYKCHYFASAGAQSFHYPCNLRESTFVMITENKTTCVFFAWILTALVYITQMFSYSMVHLFCMVLNMNACWFGFVSNRMILLQKILFSKCIKLQVRGNQLQLWAYAITKILNSSMINKWNSWPRNHKRHISCSQDKVPTMISSPFICKFLKYGNVD